MSNRSLSSDPDRLERRIRKILQRFERWIAARSLDVSTAEKYAEPYHGSCARDRVFIANWNQMEGGIARPFRGMAPQIARPRKRNWDDILSRLGFGVAWSDEYDQCGDCTGAIRTQPDSWDWSARFAYVDLDAWSFAEIHKYRECTIVCLDCLQAWAEGLRQNERQEAIEAREDANRDQARVWDGTDLEPYVYAT